jgi:hypothetical protein
MARINWHSRYDIHGYNIFGRDSDGFDRFHRDPEGFDRNGWDRDGYDRNGASRWGLWDERNEYDKDGRPLSRDGFTSDGYNIWGYDREGYDGADRDEEGYDREGYIEIWDDDDNEFVFYNRSGLRRDGININGEMIGLLNVYCFDSAGNEIIDSDDESSDDENSDDENSDDEREEEILTLNNKSGKLVLDFNTDGGENYKLKPIPICNADIPLPSGKAWEVHNLFNKEKKIFMSLYYSLGDTNFEPMTVNSVDLFIEIQRLFNAKLYNIVNTLHDYDIKISILIKALRKLLSKLYNWLVKPRSSWKYPSYCDENRALFCEAICDYTKAPPKPLPLLKIWDLYLRYIINLCLLNDELFTDIILDYSFSNVVEAYRDVDDRRNSLQMLNRLIDVEGDSCPRGWIERLILCINDYIRQQELLKVNVSKLFKGSTMHNLVELLIKDLKVTDKKEKIEKKELDLEEVEFLPLFEEFKLSIENNNIVGDLETKKRILKNKLYCFIMERLNKTYKISDTFPIRNNIDKYVDSSIYEDDFNDIEGKYKKKYLKYKKKYLKYKNKYLNLKNKY